jgi:hypothetical protein
MADRDTHRGELNSDGIVLALCGIRFEPRQLPFDRVSLPGHPQDRDQICPDCRAAGGTR